MNFYDYKDMVIASSETFTVTCKATPSFFETSILSWNNLEGYMKDVFKLSENDTIESIEFTLDGKIRIAYLHKVVR